MYNYIAKEGTAFSYNRDFSGMVVISKDSNLYREISIPGKDILEFVAYCYALQKKIENIENMSVEELLK